MSAKVQTRGGRRQFAAPAHRVLLAMAVGLAACAPPHLARLVTEVQYGARTSAVAAFLEGAP